MTIAAFPLLLALAAPLPAQAAACEGQPGPSKVKLTLIADGVRNSDGEVAFTIYPDDRSRFLKGGAKFARARVPSQSGSTKACFWLEPKGYAVAVYHDANRDRDFNRTLFSVKEGFAFSNDPSTTLGIPSFRATRFMVPAAGSTVRMKMRYPD